MRDYKVSDSEGCIFIGRELCRLLYSSDSILSKLNLVNQELAFKIRVPNNQVLSISWKFNIFKVKSIWSEMIEAFKLRSCSIIYTNLISSSFVCTLFCEDHQFLVWRKGNASPIVKFWISYILHALILKAPKSKSDLELTDCQYVIVSRSPLSISKACNSFINFTLPFGIMKTLYKN